MDSLDDPLILIVAGWVTLVITLAAGRLLSRSAVLPDKPNHRSSHERVTSRAGGFAICGGWFAGVVILAAFSGTPAIAQVALAFGGLAVLAFAVGFADDTWSMSSYWKFAGQLAVAALFAAVFAPLALAPAPFVGEVTLGAVGVVLTVIWIVGFMNAFNFMDGANGIAAGAACVGMCVFAVIAAFLGAPVAAAASILLALACFGFLPVNLARGKLFMGDNGSQSISFIIAGLGVFVANETDGRVSALVMPVIFLPFIFDVTWTLGHRMLRKKSIVTAHREHLYQLMLRFGASHLRVAMIYMGLTAFSSAAAIIMLALAPQWQWTVPVILCVAFTIFAMRIHNAAMARGFLDDKKGDPDTQAPALDPLSRAAE